MGLIPPKDSILIFISRHLKESFPFHPPLTNLPKQVAKLPKTANLVSVPVLKTFYRSLPQQAGWPGSKIWLASSGIQVINFW